MLTFFTAVGQYVAVAADGVYDVGVDPDSIPVSGSVTFIPMVNVGDSLQVDTSNVVLQPVTARLKSGRVSRNGVDGVRLTANSPDLNLDGDLYYRVEFADLTAGGVRVELSPFEFLAPTTDSTLDLVTVAPVAGLSAEGVTRGPKGPAGAAVDDVEKVGSSPDVIQFYAGGEEVGDPLQLTVSAGTIVTENITDSTAVGRAVVKAVDAAAARTAIGAGTSNLELGTTGSTAAAGNDSRLSDQRVPVDGSVGTGKLATDAVTNAKVADDAIGVPELSATGTPSSSTFLRGDNTWATPPAAGSPAWADVTGKPSTFPPTIGSTSSTAVAGNDARLSDRRSPLDNSVGPDQIVPDAVGWSELNASGTPTSTTFLKVAADGSMSAAEPPGGGSGIPASIVDAKGDLIVATGADTVARVPVGLNAQVLTADASQTSGVRWATPASGGTSKRELRSFMQPFSDSPYPASDLVGTVTPTTTAPSYTSMVNWTWSTYGSLFRIGGNYQNISGVGFNNVNGQTGGSAITGSMIEWYQPGDRFSLNMQSYGFHDYRIFVDGMPLSIDWTHYPSTAAYYDLPVQFATSRTRKITLLNGQTGFNILRTPGSPVYGQPYAAEPRFKCSVITDSFWHGGVAAAGAISAGTMAGEFMIATGFEVWDLAQGGTGYQNGGGGSTANGPNGATPFGSTARLAALSAIPAMDMCMVFGGVNDASLSTFPVSTTVTKANALWNAIKAARPNTPLVVGGIQSGVYPTIVADMTTLSNAIKAAALANPNVDGFVDMFTDPDRWVQGTGNETNKTGNGNADLFVSGPPGDGIHPNHPGFRYQARRYAQKLAPMAVA